MSLIITDPTPPMTDSEISEQNQLFYRWSSMVARNIRSSAGRFTKGKDSSVSKHGRTEYKVKDSIKSKTKMDYGIIDRVTISFERHAVFLHKGVGRGYKMVGGMVVRTATSHSLVHRHPSDWFNPVIAQSLPELANKIAALNADAVLNTTRIMLQ
jgi:hypothetical protein